MTNDERALLIALSRWSRRMMDFGPNEPIEYRPLKALSDEAQVFAARVASPDLLVLPENWE